MMRYAAIGALSVALAASGVAWWQHARAERLSVQVEALTAALGTCNARVNNAKEAANDLEEVNTWDGISDVPGRWIVPEAGADN